MWFRVSTKSEHQSFEVDLEKWTKCDRFSSSVLPFIFMPANHLITILATEKSWFLYIFFLLTTLIPTLSYKEVTTWNLCELILICGKELPFNFGIQNFYGQFKQLMGAVHNGLPWLKPHVYLLLSVFLFQVIQWCTHHKDDPPPPEDDENKEKRTDDIPVWDQEFLKVDQGTLFELILVNILELFCIFFGLNYN